jgi:hypothetical protein
MSDDLDLSSIDRRHEPTAEFRARVRGLVADEAMRTSNRRTATRRGRRLVALVAAVVVVAIVVGLALRERPAKPPIIDTDPTPVSEEAYAVVFVDPEGRLVATQMNGDETVIGRVPSSVIVHRTIQRAEWIYANVSATGWVAVTGIMSEGFWFFSLTEPDLAPIFVAVPGLNGGHQSHGAWNPSGTLYAAAELGRTVVVIDPRTGELTKLAHDDPAFGYPPVWSADGTGLVVTGEAPACISAPGAVTPRRLSLLPIDGGPVVDAVPQLVADRSEVGRGGAWLGSAYLVGGVSERCGPAPTGPQPVVVVEGDEATTWIGPNDVAPGQISDAVFSNTRKALWVLTMTEAVAPELDLYLVDPPVTGAGGRNARPAPIVTAPQGGYASTRIAAIAPDDSIVVVAEGFQQGEQGSALLAVPTDGSPPVRFGREDSGSWDFAGFITTSLLTELLRWEPQLPLQ